jgi:hypothetical protein
MKAMKFTGLAEGKIKSLACFAVSKLRIFDQRMALT